MVIGTQSASLAVTKRGPRIARAGTVVTYAITVRNTNPTNAATSVVVSDLLPVGYSVAQRPKGTKFLKGKLVWNLGTLAAGASKTVKVQIRLDRSRGRYPLQHRCGLGGQRAHRPRPRLHPRPRGARRSPAADRHRLISQQVPLAGPGSPPRPGSCHVSA